MYAYTHVGTPYYMSPEQINEAKYNDKSDVWSASCIIYELLALRPPFEANNSLALAVKIKEGKFSRIPSRYSDELWTLIRSMLRQRPEERPSVQELLSLPNLQI